VAAVWSGPSIDGKNWRRDPAVAEIVLKLAPRRTALTEAERKIEEFAKSLGTSNTDTLVAVFAGLFETLNAERSQVIEGLIRFGANQKELAATIRRKSASPGETTAKPAEQPGKHAEDTGARDLELDLRLFDERRQSLNFVCETPTLIEQRLFALARAIQRNLN